MSMRSDSHLDKLFRKQRYTLYHPAMSDENVRRLYRLKIERKKPMTRLLDEILNEYFEQLHNHHETEEGGRTECMSVKSAGTHSKPKQSDGEVITMPGISTARSAELNATPQIPMGPH